MDNAILDEIKRFAIDRLKGTYGYCGCADAPDFAMLNSEDRDGKDIKITIKIESNQNYFSLTP